MTVGISEIGPRHSTADGRGSRGYRDEAGNWHDNDSFGRDDLPLARFRRISETTSRKSARASTALSRVRDDYRVSKKEISAR